MDPRNLTGSKYDELVLSFYDFGKESTLSKLLNKTRGLASGFLRKPSLKLDLQTADDLTQDCLIKIWKGLTERKYEPTKNPRGYEFWVARVAVNTFINFYRARKNNPSKPSIDEDGLLVMAEYLPASDDSNRYLNHEALQKTVQELFDMTQFMPPTIRESYLLCVQEGLPYEEIATTAGIPIGTVRSRIHRGRKIMNELLDKTKARERWDPSVMEHIGSFHSGLFGDGKSHQRISSLMKMSEARKAAYSQERIARREPFVTDRPRRGPRSGSKIWAPKTT